MQHNGLAADEEANCHVLLAAVQSGDADGVSHYSKQLEVNLGSPTLNKKPTPHHTTLNRPTPCWIDLVFIVSAVHQSRQKCRNADTTKNHLIVFLCHVTAFSVIRLSLFACKADVCIAHLPQAHSHPSELSIRARKAAVAFFMMRKDPNKAGLLQDILLEDVEE